MVYLDDDDRDFIRPRVEYCEGQCGETGTDYCPGHDVSHSLYE
jgi:hypothetical protein